MTDCPPRLRGALSKWLCEINTGVYVGQLSSRVRDALWDRVCKNLQTGRATMVYTTNGEQKMDFRVHNTSWTPVDFDGIKLMRRPLPQGAAEKPSLKPGFSKAAKRQMAARRASARLSAGDRFVLIDLETTGLQPGRDEIIEFGALRIDGDKETEFSCLVRPAGPLPKTIAELTGLTDETLQAQGLAMEQALQQVPDFYRQGQAGRIQSLVRYGVFARRLPADRPVDACEPQHRPVEPCPPQDQRGQQL